MGVEISRLGNGLTIVTHTMPQIESVALGIWVKSGSRNEKFEEHGVAHRLSRGQQTARPMKLPLKSKMSVAKSMRQRVSKPLPITPVS